MSDDSSATERGATVAGSAAGKMYWRKLANEEKRAWDNCVFFATTFLATYVVMVLLIQIGIVPKWEPSPAASSPTAKEDERG